jgi:membrane protein
MTSGSQTSRSFWPLAAYATLALVAFARRGARPRPVRERRAADALRAPASRESRANRAAASRANLQADEAPVAEAPVADASWWGMFKAAGSQWMAHKDSRLGAALSYYSVFSIGPLIVIAVAVAGLFFGPEIVRAEVSGGLRSLLGDAGAKAIDAMLAGANRPRDGILATVIGVGTLIFAAIGVVVQLKDALNTVWEVQTPPGKGIWGFARTYVLSFAGVLSLGFLLLTSMMITTALSATGKYFQPYLPEAVFQVVTFLVSFGVITVLFAMMFKWLPDTKIEWRDVWVAAIVTAALFEIGKFLIGLYIGKQGLESTYGAASSIVVVLIWVYYSAQLVLFGAEFSNVYAKARGSLKHDPSDRQALN